MKEGQRWKDWVFWPSLSNVKKPQVSLHLGSINLRVDSKGRMRGKKKKQRIALTKNGRGRTKQ